MKRGIPLLLLMYLLPFLGLAQVQKDAGKERQQMEFDRHFFAGMKEKMIRNFDESVFEFRAAIKLNPTIANVHYQLATVLVVLKQSDEAILEADRAFKLDPNNVWYSKFLIELYKTNKQYSEAVEVCKLAYKKTQDSHFLIESATLNIMANKLDKAILSLNEYEKVKGISEQVSRQKEELYLSKGNIKSATKEIEKLCKAYPDQLAYMGILADLYMNGKKQKQALPIYQKIQRADSLNGFAAFSLADYYQRIGDTLGCFSQLLIGMKSSLEPKFKMQVLAKLYPSMYFGSNHKKKCETLNVAFMEANPDAVEPYMFSGDLMLQEKRLEEARNYYLLATAKSSNYLLAWDQILFCDQQAQQYDWMKADCEKVMALFPDYPTAYILHGIACRQLKDYKAGFESAQAGVNMAGDETMLIQMLSSLGDLAHYYGRYATSDSAFEAILSIDPNNSLALNNYAYFLSLRNTELDKAANMSKRSIELDAGNPSNLDTYGWILYMKKDYEGAKVEVLKSLQISPNNAEVREHLGDILYKLDQTEEAIVQWKKAKELGATGIELDQKIKNKGFK
ncbi:MAG: hypothetical protein SGJ00_14085 [bacterium]|nr:hypothetical protein [bacterium]